MRRAELASQLQELERAGLVRRRRGVQGPQGPLLRADGAEFLAFASNDYLGPVSYTHLTLPTIYSV